MGLSEKIETLGSWKEEFSEPTGEETGEALPRTQVAPTTQMNSNSAFPRIVGSSPPIALPVHSQLSSTEISMLSFFPVFLLCSPSSHSDLMCNSH